MKPIIKSILLSCVLLATPLLFAQKEHKRYIGKHFGDHENWEYFINTSTHKNGDTLVYEEIRNTRSEILPATVLQHRHIIKMLVKDSKPIIVSDSAYYSGTILFAVNDHGNEIVANGKPIKRGKEITFSSLESIQLYFKYNPPTRSYLQDVAIMDDPDPRPFRIKVVGEIKIQVTKKYTADCYEVAVFSLDSSNVMDSKLYIDKLTNDVVKKEYIVNEKNASDRKSVATELMIDKDYKIDLQSIKSPTASDYVEAAFSEINDNKNYKKAQQLVDRALELDPSFITIQAKLNLMEATKSEKDILVFLQKYLENQKLKVIDIHTIGRSYLNKGKLAIATEILEFNAKKHPDDYTTIIGLARLHDAKGELKEAQQLLEKALTLTTDEDVKNRIKANIERLKQGMKMS